MTATAPRLAVLIDADNAPSRVASRLFGEIEALGVAHVRRIYGDFSGQRLAGWDGAIQAFALVQHQQRANTMGKNAADIALVIDAMDLLHRQTLDGFCLVSSDADFTRLAQRIREEGLVVYGFGEPKAPAAFRNACTRFIDLEDRPQAVGPARPSAVNGAAALIRAAVQSLADGCGWAPLSAVGSRLAQEKPDFDPRSYGAPRLGVLVERAGGFEVRRTPGGPVFVRLVATGAGR